MSTTIEDAVLAVVKARGEMDHAFAELVQLIRSAGTALEHDDRVEAARLLHAACDLEYDLLGQCEIAGGLFEPLGLADLDEHVSEERGLVEVAPEEHREAAIAGFELGGFSRELSERIVDHITEHTIETWRALVAAEEGLKKRD